MSSFRACTDKSPLTLTVDPEFAAAASAQVILLLLFDIARDSPPTTANNPPAPATRSDVVFFSDLEVTVASPRTSKSDPVPKLTVVPPVCSTRVTCAPNAAAPSANPSLSDFACVLFSAVTVNAVPSIMALPLSIWFTATVAVLPTVMVAFVSTSTKFSDPLTPTSNPPDAPVTLPNAISALSSPISADSLTSSATTMAPLPIVVTASRSMSISDEITDRPTPAATAIPSASDLFLAVSCDDKVKMPAEYKLALLPTRAVVDPVSPIFTAAPTAAPP